MLSMTAKWNRGIGPFNGTLGKSSVLRGLVLMCGGKKMRLTDRRIWDEDWRAQ
jgi:hypothetical protein